MTWLKILIFFQKRRFFNFFFKRQSSYVFRNLRAFEFFPLEYSLPDCYNFPVIISRLLPNCYTFLEIIFFLVEKIHQFWFQSRFLINFAISFLFFFEFKNFFSLLKLKINYPKLSHFFQKKTSKSVTIWEHLPKRYDLKKKWILCKKFQKTSKKCDNLGTFTQKVLFLDYNKPKKGEKMWQFGVSQFGAVDCSFKGPGIFGFLLILVADI